MASGKPKPSANSSKSGGNQGARGSRGIPNDGAETGTIGKGPRGITKPGGQAQDLRDANARGGGGKSSGSSRSR